MKDARAIQQVYERYQRERTAFVGSFSELSRHEGNCELLEASDGAHLLQGLLTDPVVGIRRTSTLALGRLAAHSKAVANKIVADGAVKTLTSHLLAPLSDAAASSGETSRRREGLELRRAAAFALRNACKHNRSITNAVVEAGALNAAAACLSIPDSEIREAAAWLIDCIAGQGEDLAQLMLEDLGPLVACLDCSEISLKRAAAAALGSIAQYGPPFAQAVAAAGAVAPLACVLTPRANSVDLRLARHALCALSQIALGGADLAIELVATGVLTALVQHLSSPDELVQRFAASTLRDIACHDASLAKEVASTQHCLQLLVQAMQQSKGLNALPEIMALGHICADSSALAEAVINAGALNALTVAIAHNPEEPAKCAAAWAVGQVGRHGPLQAQAVTESGALLALTGLEVAPSSSSDLALKCSKAACNVISKLESLPALDALLRMPVSSSVKLAVLERLYKVLSTTESGSIKILFVQNEGLQLVQEIGEEPGSPYQEKVSQIIALFPQELVNRYSPAYNKALLERLTMTESATVQQEQQPVVHQPPQQQQPLVYQPPQEQQSVEHQPPSQQGPEEEIFLAPVAAAPPPPPQPPTASDADENTPPTEPFPNDFEEEEAVKIEQQQLPPPIADPEKKVPSPVAAATAATDNASDEPQVLEEEKTVVDVIASSGTATIAAPQPPVPEAAPPVSWSATPHKPLPHTPRDSTGSAPSPRTSE